MLKTLRRFLEGTRSYLEDAVALAEEVVEARRELIRRFEQSDLDEIIREEGAREVGEDVARAALALIDLIDAEGKHPGPWSLSGAPGEVVDSQGKTVLLPVDQETGQAAFSDSAAERLVLSLPDVLSHLRTLVMALGARKPPEKT